MPIVRAKFESVSLESAPNMLSGWSWKNTSNLLHKDGLYSNFSPDTTPTIVSGNGATYSTHYLVLSNLDFNFPDNQQVNYKLSLKWKYNLSGTGLSAKVSSLRMIFPNGDIGKEKITNSIYLNSGNSNKDLVLSDGFWTTTSQSQSLTYDKLNDPNFKIKVAIDVALNNFNSNVNSFGIDYFYLDVSWDHKYGTHKTRFSNANVIHRTNVSTDTSNYPQLLGSGAGWTWNTPSNALLDDSSYTTYSTPTQYNFGRVSNSSNYGQYDYYVSDYLYLRNTNSKIDSSYDIVGFIVQYKKRAYYQTVTNGYSELKAFDDEVRIYDGSSIIGENRIGPLGLVGLDKVPLVRQINDLTSSWYGYLPGGSDNFNSLYYGEKTDKWGLNNLTPTLVNDSNFGILISPKFSVHWWEKSTYPIPWGVNFATISFYYKLYNTEEFITVENLDSEENVSSNSTIHTEAYINPSSIATLEDVNSNVIFNDGIISSESALTTEYVPPQTLVATAFIYPSSIISQESFSLNFEQFIEPSGISSLESFSLSSLTLPDIGFTGNIVTSFLNFEVLNYDSSFGSTYFTWKNPNGAKYISDNDYAYLDVDN